MAPVTFTVSEVRVAATCPRIAYFDAEHARRRGLARRPVTRIWKAGAEETARGALFHNAIESFNRRALDAPEVLAALEAGLDRLALEQRLRVYLNRECIDLDALARCPARQQEAFTRVLDVYMGELADIVADALARGKPAREILDHLFGDRRRRVDVTFQVGRRGEPARVTGVLDYVFHDWRAARDRILDYKLTPAGEPANDLFQVALYALMHNVQHRTEPDVGVLYLHPERRMVELTWEQVHAFRHRMFDLLASMARWIEFDETTGMGLKPPGEPLHCPLCKWDKNGQCAKRLGPKHVGERLSHWSSRGTQSDADDLPIVERHETSGPSRPWAEDTKSEREAADDPTAPPPGAREETSPPPPHSDPPPRLDSLRLGTCESNGEPVELPLSALLTHVAVVGAAGSGKTWMAKVVAEEAVRLGVPVLAVDPQGDLVQFLRPGPEPISPTSEELVARRTFLERVEPRVWTPGSSHGRRLCLDPIRLPGRGELMGFPDPERRDEAWRAMLAGAAAQLVALAKMGGETDLQQAFLIRVLQSLAGEGAGRDVDLERLASVVMEPAIAGVPDSDHLIKKSEREKLARKLNGLRLGPNALLFTGGERLDLEAMCRSTVPGKLPLNVVYLNALTDDDQKHAFVAALASEIHRWMTTSGESVPGRPRLLFYIDEARDFIPAGNTKRPAKEPLIRLFAQGRKFGVACLLCTQSPRSVDYNVFGNCSTKLVGRLESAQDLDRVSDWFATVGPAPPWLSSRKGASAGSFVGRWPGMLPAREGDALRGRSLYSLHEGAWSPERVEQEVSSPRAPQRD